MRNIHSILCTALALSVVSCGGSGNKPASVADTATVTAVDTSAPAYTLMGSGIGDIVLGMQASDIPESIAGLYDRVDKYEGKSFTGYSFVLNSIETFNAEDTDFDGKINLIALRGNSPLKATAVNGLIYIGLPESELLKEESDILLVKREDRVYVIDNFIVQIQDGKVNEIYIEWDPEMTSK